eukprot:3970279-Ditylum_brightwellii.AAC.1
MAEDSFKKSKAQSLQRDGTKWRKSVPGKRPVKNSEKTKNRQGRRPVEYSEETKREKKKLNKAQRLQRDSTK